MNHFDEFTKFLESQTALSRKFRNDLIARFAAGMGDAYEKGLAAGRKTSQASKDFEPCTCEKCEETRATEGDLA